MAVTIVKALKSPLLLPLILIALCGWGLIVTMLAVYANGFVKPYQWFTLILHAAFAMSALWDLRKICHQRKSN